MFVPPIVIVGIIVFFLLPRPAKEIVVGLSIVGSILLLMIGAVVLFLAWIDWKSVVQFCLVLGSLFIIGMIIGGIATVAMGNTLTEKGNSK